IIYDQNDQPVEYLSDRYRPDRYNYKVNLAVTGAGQASAEGG
ncbi:MAG: GntR family transcriptional regulator, partial [Rhodospirillaceae bacterium]|nr:GntR family transcriptional regulator [Rhodospirillaceae bacterium]